MPARPHAAAAAFALLVATAALPSAFAQSAYCMPNAPPGACFTFELLMESAPADAGYPTLMTLRIRNLQGSTTSDPASFGINSFGVSRTATPGGDLAPFGADFLQVRPAGPLAAFGGPVEFNPQPMTPFVFGPEYDPDQRVLESEGTGIGGCASVPQPPEGYFADAVARTCAVQGSPVRSTSASSSGSTSWQPRASGASPLTTSASSSEATSIWSAGSAVSSTERGAERHPAPPASPCLLRRFPSRPRSRSLRHRYSH